MKRRTFILISSAIASLAALLSALRRSVSRPPLALGNAQPTLPERVLAKIEEPLLAKQGQLPERILGKTGEPLPLFGLGGAGKTPLSWGGAESEAIAIIERALELGIRYFDTAASYGPSENYLGKVLPAHRSQVFLATKTAARDRDGAWRELERSLQRLQTDYKEISIILPIAHSPPSQSLTEGFTQLCVPSAQHSCFQMGASSLRASMAY